MNKTKTKKEFSWAERIIYKEKRSCQNKQSLEIYEAKKVILKLKAKDPNPDKLVIYKCKLCSKFHIGHIKEFKYTKKQPKDPKGIITLAEVSENKECFICNSTDTHKSGCPLKRK